MTKKRKNWSGEEIVKILKRHLVEKVELSKVCEEVGCCPSQFYRWQRQFFEGGAAVFERSGREEKAVMKEKKKSRELEEKLRRKDEVLAELMEEHVRLKKNTGEGCARNG